MTHPIILYDGLCGLCNRWVQFVLRRDRTAVFRFAPLQSAIAKEILVRHGIEFGDLNTIYVVLNHQKQSETLLDRSAAALFILKQLSQPWRAFASIAGLVPRPVRNWVYGIIARNRYRVFGRYDSCPLPSAENRSRFLAL